MAPSRAQGKTRPGSENKFGFRPLRLKAASQGTPHSRKAVRDSPKRARDDVAVKGCDEDRAKRAKPANKVTGTTVIGIVDDEEPGTGTDSNKTGFAVSSGSIPLKSRSTPGGATHAHIVDLTIDSPPSESSPEPCENPIANGQGERDSRRMLDAELTTADSEVQYQFAFRKSRGGTFPGVIKPEVEEQVSLMLPRYSTFTHPQ
jgi:hypothetical protein